MRPTGGLVKVIYQVLSTGFCRGPFLVTPLLEWAWIVGAAKAIHVRILKPSSKDQDKEDSRNHRIGRILLSMWSSGPLFLLLSLRATAEKQDGKNGS